MSDQQQQAASPGGAFREGFVEADGFRIRYCEAGQGAPLVHLHGAGGLRLNAAHDLLAARYRVIAIEMPGFGQSEENTRTRTMPELAATIVKAADALGLDRFDLMGTSFGGKAALWLAVQHPERVRALVLEAPAAIRPSGTAPVVGHARADGGPALCPSGAHAAECRPTDPEVQAKQQRLVARLRGPDRDAELEGGDAPARHSDAGAVRDARPRDPARDGPPLQGTAAERPSRAGLRCRARDRRRAAGGVLSRS